MIKVKTSKTDKAKGGPGLSFDGEYLSNGIWLVSKKHYTVADQGAQMMMELGQKFRMWNGKRQVGEECTGLLQTGYKQHLPEVDGNGSGFRRAELSPLVIKPEGISSGVRLVVDAEDGTPLCVVSEDYCYLLERFNAEIGLWAKNEDQPVVTQIGEGADREVIALAMPKNIIKNGKLEKMPDTVREVFRQLHEYFTKQAA